MIQAGKLTSHLNQLLHLSRFQESAMNGIQVQGPNRVSKVAFAVDGVLESFQKAAEWGADYMIVHHGLFWGRPFPLRGSDYRRVKTLIKNDIALYAVHLPLDAHIELGHAAQLLLKLGVESTLEPFGAHGDTTIGALGQHPEITREAMLEKLNSLFGSEMKTLSFGKERIKTVACVTGQGADFSLLKEAQIKNVDLYISGETSHPTYHYCREAWLNLCLCGHYQTETFGIKALMNHLHQLFDIEVAFFDIPTGF